MYYFRIGQTHVWTAENDCENAIWDTKLILPGFFARRKLFPQLIRAHASSYGLPLRPHLLIAHGKTVYSTWNFVNAQGNAVPVQNWINEHDGKSSALLLFTCNLLNLEIHSKHSLVIHLNRVTSRWDLRKGGQLRLYHPTYGYIEDNYYRMKFILSK